MLLALPSKVVYSGSRADRFSIRIGLAVKALPSRAYSFVLSGAGGEGFRGFRWDRCVLEMCRVSFDG